MKSQLPLLLGGLVVVAVSGLAAYVGAQAGQGPAGTAPPHPGSDLAFRSMVLTRLDEQDRALGNLAESLRRTELAAQSALEIATALREGSGRRPVPRAPVERPAEEPPGGDGADGPGTGEDGAGLIGDPEGDGASVRITKDMTPEELAAVLAQAQRESLRRWVPQHLAHLAEVSEEAEAVRRENLTAEVLRLRLQAKGLTPEQEREAREVLAREQASEVREIGPLVRAGELQDPAVVLERFEGFWARTDAALQQVLRPEDFDAWKAEARLKRDAVREHLGTTTDR